VRQVRQHQLYAARSQGSTGCIGGAFRTTLLSFPGSEFGRRRRVRRLPKGCLIQRLAGDVPIIIERQEGRPVPIESPLQPPTEHAGASADSHRLAVLFPQTRSVPLDVTESAPHGSARVEEQQPMTSTRLGDLPAAPQPLVPNSPEGSVSVVVTDPTHGTKNAILWVFLALVVAYFVLRQPKSIHRCNLCNSETPNGTGTCQACAAAEAAAVSHRARKAAEDAAEARRRTETTRRRAAEERAARIRTVEGVQSLGGDEFEELIRSLFTGMAT
jgi:hypothetical protein